MALDAGLIDYALAITLNGLVRHTHNDKSKDKNTNKNQLHSILDKVSNII